MLNQPQDVIALNNPIDALQFVAWSAFKDVASQIDQAVNAHIYRDAFTVAGRRTSLYLEERAKNKFLVEMELETEAGLTWRIDEPPPPTVQQTMALSKHREAFIRTFIGGNQQRLADMIAHYADTCPENHEFWVAMEQLSRRPRADELDELPPLDGKTHGRILSHVWQDIGDEQYGDVSCINPQVLLSWIETISPTIAGQLKDLRLP